MIPLTEPLSIPESLHRYGTIAFSVDFPLKQVMVALQNSELRAARAAFFLPTWAWWQFMPLEFKDRLLPLVMELTHEPEYAGAQSEMAVRWLIRALVYRIEELGGRAWLEAP